MEHFALFLDFRPIKATAQCAVADAYLGRVKGPVPTEQNSPKSTKSRHAWNLWLSFRPQKSENRQPVDGAQGVLMQLSPIPFDHFSILCLWDRLTTRGLQRKNDYILMVTLFYWQLRATLYLLWQKSTKISDKVCHFIREHALTPPPTNKQCCFEECLQRWYSSINSTLSNGG